MIGDESIKQLGASLSKEINHFAWKIIQHTQTSVNDTTTMLCYVMSLLW
jgi:hypothetical protein